MQLLRDIADDARLIFGASFRAELVSARPEVFGRHRIGYAQVDAQRPGFAALSTPGNGVFASCARLVLQPLKREPQPRRRR
jgi:hypothetical protein